LGADVVKVNVPKFNPEKDKLAPAPYSTTQFNSADALAQIVQSAGKTLVIFSGGEKQDESNIVEKARHGMEAGGTGVIFGRNMWQRPMDEALKLAAEGVWGVAPLPRSCPHAVPLRPLPFPSAWATMRVSRRSLDM
jgi:class I fructose-bisphosphate aldolase